MFLSCQTYEGLEITTKSVIGASKYMINNGIPWMLASRFNQDKVEETFGLHRSFGGKNDNPTVFQVGYQSANTLRMQRPVVTPTGNTKGACKKKRKFSWFNVEETPLKIELVLVHLRCSEICLYVDKINVYVYILYYRILYG